ncbi:replicative DNA helicase [Pseudoalteromonas sp. 13-15]|jgi:replicative DNA helicase|uniref:Replicative DNA helicase n=1 Tax=Pseudoalteromonas marina TaxID=267375 RepID=A0ABT9FHS8_9GAMM|nr:MULTISPECIES: replicative DNA helicase [Pseudoalteromonas]EAW27025.1 replicative DNA helicase; chromosome replication; chain elongation [Alteromonadales bacterium TW-7]MBL1384336.1 replicative DNA helicase [Colwellia sp.]ATG57284.1 replicative DNA helicase [Pseudoalteromonas marina]AUL73633.1 replicative DNA helicase [Pseudoalteromonas sp. 13-15]KAF7776969.1 replicative DNA helicase [Pseudoalteromonas marina]|tara:strand:- start:2864 stop:4243 length:1380 start_codon:yes stop_codon:yes gene_type:complete
MAKPDKQVDTLKVPPHSIEAEQSVLGGLMLDNQAYDRVAELVVSQDFYTRTHKLIFEAMTELAELGDPIDLITISESLEKNNKLAGIGGFAYLAEIAKNTPSAANIDAYANIVRERAVVREMIGVANEIAEAGFNTEGRTSHDLLDFAESKVFKIAEQRSKSTEGPQSIHNILEKTVDKIEELYQSPQDGVTGVSTGYADLDKMTTGLQPSDLIIVAARPSMGKTTFAMNLAEHAAMTQDKPVLIYSLEMPSEQIMMRMLASLGRINQTKVRTGQLDDDDWARLSSTMGLLMEKGKMYVDDASGLTPTDVRSRARRIARDHGGISMIMVDYLQLMRVPSLSDNRTLEIAEISRSLKSLAKELKCPVVALSQLNRTLEQRADKRPINSDLRESGSIEQDADLIMFIYRDEVYNEDSTEKGIAEIIIGKQRNGPIGKVRLTFQGQFSRFDNYAGPAMDDEY